MSTLLAALVLVLHAPDVEWSAPAACPGADTVLEAAAGLGADLDGVSFSLEGEIQEIEGGFRLDLQVRTDSGATTRQLEAPSCAELAQAAGLVLSVAVDPLRIPEPAPVEPEPEPEPEPETPEFARPAVEVPALLSPPTEPAADAEREPPSSPAPLMAVRGLVFASGVLGRGVSPRVDARAQLGFGLDVPYLRAEVLGFHAFAQAARYDDEPGLGADIGAWGGQLRLGPRGVLRGLELAALGGVELVAVIGEGFGVDTTWSRGQLGASVVLAPSVRLPLGRRVSIGVDTELSVAVRRPAFTVDARDLPVYRVPRIGARGGLRVEVRLFGRARHQFGASRRPRGS